jgi:hypothetical protein
MNKRRASDETVMAFIKEVYPEYTELAMSFGDEEQILKDATELIHTLRSAQPKDAPDKGTCPHGLPLVRDGFCQVCGIRMK